MENIYGIWKDYYIGKPYVIEKYYRDDKIYGIYFIYSKDIGWRHIYYFYQNNPNKIYCEAYHVAGMTSEEAELVFHFWKVQRRTDMHIKIIHMQE